MFMTSKFILIHGVSRQNHRIFSQGILRGSMSQAFQPFKYSRALMKQLTEIPKETYRKDYRPSPYLVKHVELMFKLDCQETQVESLLNIIANSDENVSEDLILDAEDLEIQYISINDVLLNMDVYNDGRIVIPQAHIPNIGNSIQLKTKVKIFPEANTKLMGLFKSNEMLCTQCEATGFRRITPFIDRPDNLATFRVKAIGDKQKYPVILSNGNVIYQRDIDEETHEVVYNDPVPKPCYLFALVAGKLYNLTEIYKSPINDLGKEVRVNIWSEDRNTDKLLWAMECIKAAMTWDEKVFGLEYDLEVFNIVSVRDFNMGAMENKSLNIFVSSLILASSDTSTDADFVRILGVIGHEYFHNWTGDRVTCRDWFQLTLKEGLTVYRDQEFVMDMAGRGTNRIDDVSLLRNRQFDEDAGPLSHSIRPESYMSVENFYTATVYEKGAEVIRMYQTILGRKGFQDGMALYFKRHDGTAVTCDDFRTAMADANDFDLSQFGLWYSQSGTPVVTLTDNHWEKDKKQYHFTLFQYIPPTKKQPTTQPLHIPIKAGLLSKNRGCEIAGTHVFHLRKDKETFVFENVEEDGVLSLLRDFSAPVTLNMKRSREDLMLLLQCDTDDYVRWDAAQQLMTNIIVDRVNKIYDNEANNSLFERFKAILTSDTIDGSMKSRLLSLPGLDILAQQIEKCNPIDLYEAHNSMKLLMAAYLYDDALKVYDDLTRKLKNKPYKILPANENVSPRSLRNKMLRILTADRSDNARKLAYRHFNESSNMTDRLNALCCLCDLPGSEKTSALKTFYDDANGDPLIIDKWFNVQAGADIPEVIDDVKALLNHKDFTLKTPSRMRSLITRFALNFNHFHAADGEGYKIVSDAVIKIDKFNSPIASRLATLLINFKQFDCTRQNLMKQELRRIMNGDQGISKETLEVCSKALDSEI